MTVLWLDPSFGASGDMLLGALVGLGADPVAVRAGLAALPVDGWSITVDEVVRCGLVATRVEVHLDDADHDADHEHHEHEAHHVHGRAWSEIDAMLAGAELPPPVRDGSRRTFRLLGEIEAAAHRVTIDDVQFHEVGAVDAIVDIVGAWIALDLLGIDRVVCGPVGLGHGTVRGAHGILPLPAPATASLLAGAPVRPIDVAMETCTPTGAALLATVGSWGPMPSGTLRVTARGAGGRDPASHPNVVTAHLVDDPAPSAATSGVVTAVVLTTNLDDVTPEVLAHTAQRLLDAGADDVWVTPITMKKSRPAFELSVLTSPDRGDALRALISTETGTLGIRESVVSKHVAERHADTIDVDGHMIRVKVGPHGAKPEHDDLAALAARTGRPVRELAAEVLRRWAAGRDA